MDACLKWCSTPPLWHIKAVGGRPPHHIRFYSLMIERDLFGRVVLVRNWGRIGTNGRELVEEFGCEIEAGQALEVVAQAKRRRGYQDL